MRIINILKLVVYNKIRPMKYAEMIGLDYGDRCKFESGISYGSEPWLIKIGNHVEITNRVSFITHDGGTWVFRDKPKYKDVIKFGKIIIEDNCFIGQGATLLPGVTIGENSVIGACSLVTRDVEPNTVVAGVPARKICTTEEYAEKALQNCPVYDKNNFKRNKREELLRIMK